MTLTSSGPVVQPLPLSRQRSWRATDSLPGPSAYSQGALALSYPLPQGLEAEPHSAALVVLRHGEPRHPPGSESWAATFIQAVIEVIASDRPLTQLVRWTSRSVYSDIAHRRDLVARHRGSTGLRPSRQQVATIRVCHPHPRSAEVAARVTVGARSRAIAARFDYQHDRWVCTALCLG